jgi:hypothetical protein
VAKKNRIELLITAKNYVSRGLARAGRALKSFGAGVSRIGKAAAVAFGVMGGAAFAVGKKMVAAYQAAAAAAAKLGATLKATGYAAGFTVSQLKEQASQIQKTTGVGDEMILSMQGILATFRGIRGDVFKRATMSVIDMDAAMSKAGASSSEIETAVIRVGKALNDPTEGMTALTRVGVMFTDQQKEQIKALQESGDLQGAQALILSELEGQFGGTAKAMADAQHGIKQMNAAFGDAQEEVGRVIVESGNFDGVIAKITASLESLAADGYIELWAQNARKAIEFLAPAIEGVGKAFGWMKDQVAGAAAFWGSISGGASIDEALASMTTGPKKVEEDTKKRLAEIKEAAEARKKAAAEKEQAEMESAQSSAARIEDQIADETTIADEKAKTAQELADLAVDIAEEQANKEREIREKAWQDEKALKEKRLAAAQDLAKKRVAEVIEEAKAQKDFAKAQEDDQKKAKRLLDNVGGKMSRLTEKDRAFVEAANQIKNAKGAIPTIEDQIKVANDNLTELQNHGRKLDDMLKKQDELIEYDKKLLAMG